MRSRSSMRIRFTAVLERSVDLPEIRYFATRQIHLFDLEHFCAGSYATLTIVALNRFGTLGTGRASA